jgi:hypothetical protein
MVHVHASFVLMVIRNSLLLLVLHVQVVPILQEVLLVLHVQLERIVLMVHRIVALVVVVHTQLQIQQLVLSVVMELTQQLGHLPAKLVQSMLLPVMVLVVVLLVVLVLIPTVPITVVLLVVQEHTQLMVFVFLVQMEHLVWEVLQIVLHVHVVMNGVMWILLVTLVVQVLSLMALGVLLVLQTRIPMLQHVPVHLVVLDITQLHPFNLVANHALMVLILQLVSVKHVLKEHTQTQLELLHVKHVVVVIFQMKLLQTQEYITVKPALLVHSQLINHYVWIVQVILYLELVNVIVLPVARVMKQILPIVVVNYVILVHILMTMDLAKYVLLVLLP